MRQWTLRAPRERRFGEEDQNPDHLVSSLHLERETLSRKQKHRAETQICFLFTYQQDKKTTFNGFCCGISKFNSEIQERDRKEERERELKHFVELIKWI